MLNRSLIFSAGLICTLLPGVAIAQTQPSWQQWVKQNPTYSNPAATPAPSSAPETSWSSSSDASGLTEQQFTQGFMQGCTDTGAPQNYCSCTLGSLRSRYSVVQLTDMFSQADPPLSLIKEIGTACLAKTR